MILFGSSAAAAIVKLRCPRCGCVQARARGAENAEYTCRACYAPFTREAGTIDETTPRSAKKR